MKKILRHKFTESKRANLETLSHYLGRRDKCIERLNSGKSMNFSALKDNHLKIISTRYFNEIDIPPTSDYLDYLNLGLVHFDQVACTADELKVNIYNKEFIVQSVESDYGADFNTAYQLYNVANILKSTNHKRKIVEYDLPFSTQVSPPFWKAIFEYLQLLENNKNDERIKKYEEISDLAKSDTTLFIGIEENKIIQHNGTSLIRQIYHYPLVTLYEHIATNKQLDFDRNLEEYLENKKAHIIENEKNDDPRYWIDFNLLGVLTFAKSCGLSIKLETEYAPKELYLLDI